MDKVDITLTLDEMCQSGWSEAFIKMFSDNYIQTIWKKRIQLLDTDVLVKYVLQIQCLPILKLIREELKRRGI